MRNLFIILLLFPFVLSAQVQPIPVDADYFVAPWGNDANTGQDTAHSWKTWHKGMTTAQAGAIVYFRGGVYYPSSFGFSGAVSGAVVYINPSDGIGYSGTPTNPISFYNYPGELPILDCRNLTAPGSYPSNRYLNGIMMYDAHWINWRGLTIRNLYQREENVNATAMSGYPVSNMTFENMVVHNIGTAGWYMHSSVNVIPPVDYGDDLFGWDDAGLGLIPYDTIRYINCDTYQCCDTLPANDGNDPGNMSDGFKYIGYAGAYLSYDGCRAWHCGDDGFDLPGAYRKRVTNCWSFGHDFPAYGDEFEGNGFKAGAIGDTVSIPTLIMTNCIATFTSEGFFDVEYPNYYRSNSRIYNNIFYKNKLGIQISENAPKPNSLSIYRNNIIYASTSLDPISRPYEVSANCLYTESNNTIDYAENGSLSNWVYSTAPVMSVVDFLQVPADQDEAILIMSAARQADNSLPDIGDYFKLAPTSDLINAGIQIPESDSSGVMLTYDGSAPDIGAFEYNEGLIAPLVATGIQTALTIRRATARGTVTSDGGATVTERGIVYGTSANPTTSNSKVIVAGTTGAFTANLTGLLTNTTYHVRSYAINSEGTSYGEDETFTTKSYSAVTSSTGKVLVENGKVIINR